MQGSKLPLPRNFLKVARPTSVSDFHYLRRIHRPLRSLDSTFFGGAGLPPSSRRHVQSRQSINRLFRDRVQSSPVPVQSCPVLSCQHGLISSSTYYLVTYIHNYVCMKASPALPENLPRSACHFCVRCLVLVMKKRTSVLPLSTYLT